MSVRICFNCQHWFFLENDLHGNKDGECRRIPPKNFISPKSGMIKAYFPKTEHDEWCGEFKEKGDI